MTTITYRTYMLANDAAHAFERGETLAGFWSTLPARDRRIFDGPADLLGAAIAVRAVDAAGIAPGDVPEHVLDSVRRNVAAMRGEEVA